LHHLEGRYPFFLAPTSSCAKPVPSSGIHVSTLISRGPCRLLRTPAGNRFFPTLSLQVFPRMPEPLIPSGGRVHMPVTSPTSSAFPKSRPWVGFPESPRKETSCGGCFEIVAIPYVQASWFVRHPGLPCRCALKSSQDSRDFYTRANHASSPNACIGHASRLKQATDGRRTFTFPDLQPCRPLPTSRFIRLVPPREGCRLPSRQGVPPVTR